VVSAWAMTQTIEGTIWLQTVQQWDKTEFLPNGNRS